MKMEFDFTESWPTATTYEYDFGDAWVHDVYVERVEETTVAMQQAVCLDGARACPPEDSGGPRGYVKILEVMLDPHHEGHEDIVERIGGHFDPELFNLGEVNARIQWLR